MSSTADGATSKLSVNTPHNSASPSKRPSRRPPPSVNLFPAESFDTSVGANGGVDGDDGGGDEGGAVSSPHSSWEQDGMEWKGLRVLGTVGSSG